MDDIILAVPRDLAREVADQMVAARAEHLHQSYTLPTTPERIAARNRADQVGRFLDRLHRALESDKRC